LPQKTVVVHPEEKNSLGDPDVDGRIFLRYVSITLR
jgi:hypothetical protein